LGKERRGDGKEEGEGGFIDFPFGEESRRRDGFFDERERGLSVPSGCICELIPFEFWSNRLLERR
jgi:hypothetical protein